MARPYSFYKRWYKTDKQKIAHINKYWNKDSLFTLLEDYLIPCRNIWENDPDDIKMWNDCKQLKTKKAVLEKYINQIWEFVWEEYSYY